MTAGRPAISEDEKAVGVYLFDERAAGSVVHNAVHGGIDLNIPKRFSLVHQIFLEPFWKEFRATRDYFSDVLVNIAGFVPLGFVFLRPLDVRAADAARSPGDDCARIRGQPDD